MLYEFSRHGIRPEGTHGATARNGCVEIQAGNRS